MDRNREVQVDSESGKSNLVSLLHEDAMLWNAREGGSFLQRGSHIK